MVKMLYEDKILVTGGSGYIGQATMSLIPKALNADLRDNGYPINLLNYNDLHIYMMSKEIKAVLHLAAFKSINDSLINPINYYYNNMISSLNILKVCKELNIPIVFASSAAIYNNGNPYSKTKIFFEEIIKDSFVDYIVLRYFNVGGLIKKPNEYQNGNIFDIIRNCLNLDKDFTLNKYTSPRDYSHVMDIAEINVEALKMVMGGIKNKTYDVYSGSSTSLDTIINMYKEKGFNIKTVENSNVVEKEVQINKNRFPHINKFNIEDIINSEIKYGFDKK